MKIKKGYILRKVNEDYLVAAIGKESKKFSGYIVLNNTGAFLWEKLEIGIEKNDLYKALQDEYGIDEETARNDVKEFISTLKGAKIIE